MEGKYNPADVVISFYTKIEKRYKITFFAALIAGLLSHLYQFTNKLFNYDELYHTPEGFGAGLSLGRWGLELTALFVKKFFGNYSLPMINGMTALFFIIISACIVVAVFDIKDFILVGLTGALFAVFPTVTSTFFFMYTAPYYAFALFLSCLSSWLLVKYMFNWKAFLAAALLLAFSTGIYQTYFIFAVCIVLISIMLFCFYMDDFRSILKRAFYSLFYLIISIVTYLFVNKLFVFITKTELSDYQGISEIGRMSVSGAASGIIKAYKEFLKFFFKDALQTNPTIFVKLIVSFLWLTAALLCLRFLLDRRKNSGVKILFILLLLFLPLAIDLVYVMAAGAWIYTIMSYSFIFMFLFPLILIDRMLDNRLRQFFKKEVLSSMQSWISMIGCLFCVMIYIWFANGNYQALQYTNYHDLAYYMVIMTQIKSLDGYREEMPVAFLNGNLEDRTNSAGDLMEGMFDAGGRSVSNTAIAYTNINLLTKYLGFTPEFVWLDDLDAVADKEEVRKMPSYPDSGSIAIVDGVIVVKFEN